MRNEHSSQGTPACMRSGISGWRDRALYPLAGGASQSQPAHIARPQESPRLCCRSHSHPSGDVSVRSPGNRGSYEHHEIECRGASNRAPVAGGNRRHTHAIASRLAAGEPDYRADRQRGLDRPSRVRAFHALLRRNASERRGASIAASKFGATWVPSLLAGCSP